MWKGTFFVGVSSMVERPKTKRNFKWTLKSYFSETINNFANESSNSVKQEQNFPFKERLTG